MIKFYQCAIGNIKLLSEIQPSVFTSYRSNHFTVKTVGMLLFVSLFVFTSFFSGCSLILIWFHSIFGFSEHIFFAQDCAANAFLSLPKWCDLVSWIMVKTVMNFFFLLFNLNCFRILHNASAFLEKDQEHSNLREMAMLLLKVHHLFRPKKRQGKTQTPSLWSL